MSLSLGFGSTKIGNFQILHFPDKKHMDFSNTSKGTPIHRTEIPFSVKVINPRINGIIGWNHRFLNRIISSTSCLNESL